MARDVNNPNDPPRPPADEGMQEQLPAVIDKSLHLPRPPFWMLSLLMTAVVVSWIPLAMVALSRVTLSERRPIEIFQGMHEQPRYGAQDVNRLFQDNRAMRSPVPGSIARGELREDDHYYRGYQMVANAEGEPTPEYYDGLPPQVEVTMGLMQRGQERFNIYCYPCHGYDGSGNGPINQRAQQLMQAGGTMSAGTSWVPATNLHEDRLAADVYADGELFGVISHGRGNMPGYASQIDPADRWAIVAYLRALQYSQAVPADALTPDQLERLQAEE
ncbi:MAG: cytochrome c [Phycisphaeraceae bacterium]